jgi:hypothetical protein
MSSILAIDGIKKELEGLKDQALAEVRIYLQSPVGVGEHSDICSELKKLMTKVGEYDSLIETIDRYINIKTEDDGNTSESSAENE